MTIPVQVSFRNMAVSDAAESACWREAERLGETRERIVACRVMIDLFNNDAAQPAHFVVRVEFTLFGGDRVYGESDDARRADERDLLPVIRRAFALALRNAADASRRAAPP